MEILDQLDTVCIVPVMLYIYDHTYGSNDTKNQTRDIFAL